MLYFRHARSGLPTNLEHCSLDRCTCANRSGTAISALARVICAVFLTEQRSPDTGD